MKKMFKKRKYNVQENLEGIITDKSTDEESFNWLHKNPKLYDFYLRFPFQKWLDIIKEIYDKDVFSDKILSGNLYQKTVNQVLLNDIFKDNKTFKYEHNEKDKKTSLYLQADFTVEIDNYNKLSEILKDREYMFQDENIKTNYLFKRNNKITIIGEICNKLSNKKIEQIKKYCEKIDEKNENIYLGNPIYILMIIFDDNYNDLYNSTSLYKNLEPKEKYFTPVVFGYIPKLYREDCYIFYNNNKKDGKKIDYYKYLKGIFYKSRVSDISEEELTKLKDINKRYQFNLEKEKEEIEKKLEEKMKKKEEEMKKKLEEEMKKKEEKMKKKEEEMKKKKKK